MDIDFRDENLDHIKVKASFTAGFDKAIVKGYRKRMQAIRAAKDERDLYAVKGNHFEKLKGNRAHQHSLRINDQWRLVVEIQPGNPKNTVTVVSIEDYR